MAKMREVRVTKPGSTKATKPVADSMTYVDANGVKVTMCPKGPVPKQVTARGKG